MIMRHLNPQLCVLRYAIACGSHNAPGVHRRATNRESSKRMRNLKQQQVQQAKREVMVMLDQNSSMVLQLARLQSSSPGSTFDEEVHCDTPSPQQLLEVALASNRCLQARLAAVQAR